MDFSLLDRSNFPTWSREESAEIFAEIKYEVQLIFDGIRLTYRLIVPELGQWWNWDGNEELQHDRHWGKTPYKAEVTMENIAAAYDVSGYRVRSDADELASSLRADTTSVTLGEHDRARISKARPRQRLCGNCRRSKQKHACEAPPTGTRCTRCVRLHITCEP